MEKFNLKKTKYLKQVNFILEHIFHTDKAVTQIDWQATKRILIIDFTGIGDLIMLIPFLKILKKNAISAQIDLCCQGYGEVLLGEQGLVNNFIIFDGQNYLQKPLSMVQHYRDIRSCVNQINQVSYDVVIEPRGDLRYIFFMNFIRAERKVSYDYTGGASMLTDVIYPSEDIKHLLEDKLYLLKMIGCHYGNADKYPELLLTQSDREKLKFLKKENRITDAFCIGVHPGASTYIKEWDKYSELISTLSKKYPDILILIFEGPNENEYVNRILRDNGNLGKRLIHIKEPLGNYLWILSICNVMICNDSAAGHIAAAYQIPTIVIFGPTEPELGKPISKVPNICISKNDCLYKPCRNMKCQIKTRECITSITVDEVMDAIEIIIN